MPRNATGGVAASEERSKRRTTLCNFVRAWWDLAATWVRRATTTFLCSPGLAVICYVYSICMLVCAIFPLLLALNDLERVLPFADWFAVAPPNFSSPALLAGGPLYIIELIRRVL